MAFPTGIANGHIRTHPDGRRWQYDATKNVWNIKTEVYDDSNYIGARGEIGPAGADSTVPGPVGPAAATYSMNGTILTITT